MASPISLSTGQVYLVGATSIPITSTGTISFSGRSILSSPADGIVEMTNNAGTGFTRLILGTNDATVNGGSIVLDTGSGRFQFLTGDGTSVLKGLQFSNAQLSGKVLSYNNEATAGYGVAAIVASNRLTAQTAAVPTVTSYTPTADASLIVEANLLATTSTTYSFNVNLVYTAEDNVQRTVVLPFLTGIGTITNSTALSQTNGPIFQGFPVHIRAKANTSITVSTSGTFTTVTYNVEAQIRRIS